MTVHGRTYSSIGTADHGKLGFLANDTVHLLAIVEDDEHVLAWEEVLLELIEHRRYCLRVSMRSVYTFIPYIPRSSIREICENWTLRRMGSLSTSGKTLSIALELLVSDSSASK